MNGQIECFNATMGAKLVSFSNQSRSNLDDQLRFLTFNYNIAIHSTTKIIPFELMYGPSPVVPCDPQNPIASFQSYFQYAPKLNRYISSLADTARRNIVLTQQSSKSWYGMIHIDQILHTMCMALFLFEIFTLVTNWMFVTKVLIVS